MEQIIKEVLIDYTNWRGERRLRRVSPLGLVFTSNEWHRKPQWLLFAVDLDKERVLSFAMSGIHSWRNVDDGSHE